MGSMTTEAQKRVPSLRHSPAFDLKAAFVPGEGEGSCGQPPGAVFLGVENREMLTHDLAFFIGP